MAFGLLNAIFGGVFAATPAGVPAGGLAYCFLALAFVSASCAGAALATNFAVFSANFGACLGALAMTIGIAAGSPALVMISGYLFVVSAVFAWYSATAMVLEDSFGYAMIPVGQFRYSREPEEVSEGIGEPGVLHGEWRGYTRKAVRA